MKMVQSDFNKLKEDIAAVLVANPEARNRYAAGQFPRAETTKDVNMRFRWDLAHVVFRSNPGFLDGLYSYLTDNHIDTALRAIVPDVV